MRKGVEKLTKQKEGKERLKTTGEATEEGRREVKEATEG